LFERLLTREVSGLFDRLLTREVSGLFNRLLTREVSGLFNRLLTREVSGLFNHLLTREVSSLLNRLSSLLNFLYLIVSLQHMLLPQQSPHFPHYLIHHKSSPRRSPQPQNELKHRRKRRFSVSNRHKKWLHRLLFTLCLKFYDNKSAGVF
jgi:hypothetical protein